MASSVTGNMVLSLAKGNTRMTNGNWLNAQAKSMIRRQAVRRPTKRLRGCPSQSSVQIAAGRTVEVRGVSVESLTPFRNMLVGGILEALDQPHRQAWAGRKAAIALGNLLTSAALLGIDACPMEGFMPAQYDEILNLEEQGLTAVAVCALGYRSENDVYAGLPKVRFPKERVLAHI